ncbi:contractile injection system tape measure protein [Aquimarina mytili]|uniref:Uncharacterized protein n=1 Tax=Aquimarina mytili TaxID=874423 RepID=A0A936ZXS2_9FLAO|nr:contractile injection system tape measure protein [Aquimarina mytili]MBL0683865.1 hypothetical protein [Aquimarina mytili]
MGSNAHIINKQIIEVVLSDRTTAFESQQRIGQLYSKQLISILNDVLDIHFDNDDHMHYQLDSLTIDLGLVTLDALPEVFAKELDVVLKSSQTTNQLTITSNANETEQGVIEERTPLRVLGYYLITGRLPWWFNAQKKSYLFEQWELLMKHPTYEFKTLLSQLHHNKTHLDRYLHTFSEEQVFKSAEWITGLSHNELYRIRNKVKYEVRKRNKKEILSFWKTDFLRVLFRPKREQTANSEVYYLEETLKILGIASHNNTEVPKYKVSKDIQSLLIKYKHLANKHGFLKSITTQLNKLIQTSAINEVPVHLLTQLTVLLEKVLLEISATEFYFNKDFVTSEMFTSLVTNLNTIEKIVQQVKPKDTPLDITRLQSQFDETDFITIENAGLVLLWPFLPRFFKNLKLLEDKDFIDESSMHKAVCALQYLCNPHESELFEGQLPLAKLLCGVPLEEPVPIILLTDEEKEIAHGLLQAVMQQGPHWKNLSVLGFRTSYLCRQASLRSRDDHWLLQVQKETYDITLQKLLWSIQAVKLPWMERALMVEWL